MSAKAKKESPEIRTFIAIEISGEVRQALESFIRELKMADPDVKWVSPTGIHLTLKFLGNIPQSLTPKIKEAMASAVTDIEAFSVKVEGTGTFPNLKRPRVFWAGVSEPTGRLAKLAERIDLELKPMGFKPEDREFHPHLTLGRSRQGARTQAAAEILSRNKEKSFGSFHASELILFMSELKPAGAVYTKLERVTFK